MARARKTAEAATPELQWAYAIRTWDADGSSYGGFKWDLTPGARTEAPDWAPTKECGAGLHANPYGMGDWSLLGDLSEVAAGKLVLGVVRYDAALAVDLDGKHKAPWMEVVLTTRTAGLGSVLAEISKHRNDHVVGLAERLKKQKTTKATTGYGSAAATTGDGSAAATTGYGSAASALGEHSIAAALGEEGSAKAGPTGAIVLAAYEWVDGKRRLAAVFAGMVGRAYGDVTIKADTFYRLGSDGVPFEVADQ